MSENSSTHPESEFVAFVGIDWADQTYARCSQRAGTTQREQFTELTTRIGLITEE